MCCLGHLHVLLTSNVKKLKVLLVIANSRNLVPSNGLCNGTRLT